MTIISELFEKCILKRLKPIIENLLPNDQFDFREKHSTIRQIHHIASIMVSAEEEEQICTAILLDVSQAFDKYWHGRLNYKVHKILPKQYVNLLQSFIKHSTFKVKQEEEHKK